MIEAGPWPDRGAPFFRDPASVHVTAKYAYARLRGKCELGMSPKLDFNTPMPMALLAKHTLFPVPHPDVKTAPTALMRLVRLVWHGYGHADVLPRETNRDQWTVTLHKGDDTWYDRKKVPIGKSKGRPLLTRASPSEQVHEHTEGHDEGKHSPAGSGEVQARQPVNWRTTLRNSAAGMVASKATDGLMQVLE